MLFSEIEKYSAEYENFAYFCKFDRDTKTIGEETLFLSNRSPILAGSDVRSFFGKLGEIGEELPFYLGYDAVSEFYPVKSIQRSGWPMAAAIVPEKTIRSKYVRKAEASIRGKVANDFTDPDMKRKIEELKGRIISGELLQVVLSRRFDLPDVDPYALLQHLVQGDGSLYVYYYRFGEYEIIGSSPENIVTRKGEVLEVHPIAGTVPRGGNDEEDRELGNSLLHDRKELREHRMLVDLARNDLGRISEAGSVEVIKSMEIQKFASVQHIVSTVQSRLRKGMSDYDVVRTLFPAGTVSGAPKVRAIQLIDQYEDCARGPYAGGLGVLSRDSLEMALLIRTVYRNSKETYTQAGAGLVMDSNPEKEVREFYSKAGTVMGGLKSASIDN